MVFTESQMEQIDRLPNRTSEFWRKEDLWLLAINRILLHKVITSTFMTLWPVVGSWEGGRGEGPQTPYIVMHKNLDYIDSLQAFF